MKEEIFYLPVNWDVEKIRFIIENTSLSKEEKKHLLEASSFNLLNNYSITSSDSNFIHFNALNYLISIHNNYFSESKELIKECLKIVDHKALDYNGYSSVMISIIRCDHFMIDFFMEKNILIDHNENLDILQFLLDVIDKINKNNERLIKEYEALFLKIYLYIEINSPLLPDETEEILDIILNYEQYNLLKYFCDFYDTRPYFIDKFFEQKDFVVIRYLAIAGVKCIIQNKNINEIILSLINDGYDDAVKSLMLDGANIDFTHNNESPISLALSLVDYDMFKTLIMYSTIDTENITIDIRNLGINVGDYESDGFKIFFLGICSGAEICTHNCDIDMFIAEIKEIINKSKFDFHSVRSLNLAYYLLEDYQGAIKFFDHLAIAIQQEDFDHNECIGGRIERFLEQEYTAKVYLPPTYNEDENISLSSHSLYDYTENSSFMSQE